LELKRTYPSEPFLAAVVQALQYGVFDLNRLERLILERVAGEFFASTAVPELIGMMREAGASREALRARLAGGASMFESVLPDNGRRLGMRNVEAAREALAAAGIPVAGEDVGGAHGRSVYLHVEDGRVVVSSVLRTDVLL
jgi:chemotaxis protein CheD